MFYSSSALTENIFVEINIITFDGIVIVGQPMAFQIFDSQLGPRPIGDGFHQTYDNIQATNLMRCIFGVNRSKEMQYQQIGFLTNVGTAKQTILVI